MTDDKTLKQVQRSEKSGSVSRRLGMLIIPLNMQGVVAEAAATCSCDPRTILLWYGRISRDMDVLDEMRSALADRPRSGRPTKIPRMLEKAEKWCANSAFTPMELCDYLEKISDVRLSLSQTRRYTKKWRCSRKKTAPIHVNKTTIQDVENWKARITRMVIQYAKRGYTIATQDESNYKDAVLSIQYWARIGCMNQAFVTL